MQMQMISANQKHILHSIVHNIS